MLKPRVLDLRNFDQYNNIMLLRGLNLVFGRIGGGKRTLAPSDMELDCRIYPSRTGQGAAGCSPPDQARRRLAHIGNPQQLRMPENKPVIGLSWEPKIPQLSIGTKKSSNELPGTSAVYKPSSELIDGLFVPPNDPKKVNKLIRKQVKDSAGKNWFDMPAPTITPELKTDLQLLKDSEGSNFCYYSAVTLRFPVLGLDLDTTSPLQSKSNFLEILLRDAMDPKRHYKKSGSKSKTLPKYFQVGTIIEPASEYYSGRLTKKERKATLTEELLSDRKLGEYRKRKVREIEERNRPGGVDKWKNRGPQSRKRAKQRRH
ncbi:hypothetical protein CQW23_12921 [Capsicum baccatum]|uniref:Fcf2 pre-rRNA processing C-terminal domain-containing protein n=1 Tax=Capsicum baccatum TaxID=33114 RepID=A0A2G2WU05_CAPBA|nr:hypothetical protein CQW23_12921 [Capsicum baccatum]